MEEADVAAGKLQRVCCIARPGRRGVARRVGLCVHIVALSGPHDGRCCSSAAVQRAFHPQLLRWLWLKAQGLWADNIRMPRASALQAREQEVHCSSAACLEGLH